MKKLYWLLTVIVLSVLFFQCQKELHYAGGPDTGVSVAPDPINASLQGNITDENDQPAAGVTVTAGTVAAITDANGYFRFTDATLDKNTTLVTAAKDGYYKGYRVFAATSGCNQVVIKLIKKDLAGTVASSSGGEAKLLNGAIVKLPAGGIVNASSNSDYSGDVKVYASYINPASSDISKIIPGSLVANSKEGKRVTLQSYGMLAVELSSTNGEKLQIKSGSTATLTIPIASASITSAPATIPLWYVDETTGIWQEEGTATKQGNNYVGEVKHFSYWNCDYPYASANVSFTLQTSDGLPLVNTYVEIKPTGSDSAQGGLAHGYTDSLGQVKGLVPANKTLQIVVYNTCSSAIYSQDISPVTSSTELGIIQVSGNTSSVVTFTGTLLDCSNQPISDGYALINVSGIIHYASTDASGKFSTTYVSCSSILPTATIMGVDKVALQQSSETTVTVATPLTDVGNLIACGSAVEQSYINYKLDDSTFNLTTLNMDSVIGYTNGDINHTTYIYGFPNSGITSDYFYFSIYNADATGTFPVVEFQPNRNYSVTTMEQPFTVTLTNFPASVGEYYEGSLSGKFTDVSSVLHTVTATFKIRRSN